MASFGKVKRVRDFCWASLKVLKTLEEKVRPGMLAERFGLLRFPWLRNLFERVFYASWGADEVCRSWSRSSD
jgi:hypothetical protein